VIKPWWKGHKKAPREGAFLVFHLTNKKVQAVDRLRWTWQIFRVVQYKVKQGTLKLFPVFPDMIQELLFL